MSACKLVKNEEMLGRLPVTVRYPLALRYQPGSSYLSVCCRRFRERSGLRPYVALYHFPAATSTMLLPRVYFSRHLASNV